MFIVERTAYPQEGVGKPDFTREVSSGRERAGISLAYNQSLMIFGLLATDTVAHPYAIPWVKDVIPVGGTSPLYNLTTGLTTLTIPQGYTMTIVQTAFGGNQDMEVELYFEVEPVLAPGVLFLVHTPTSTLAGGSPLERNLVVPYSSKIFDPDGDYSHEVEAIVYNRGGAAFRGGCTMNALMEAVGTPPLPDTKDCQCPFCNHIQTVKVGTTVIKCNNCGNTYYVQDLSRVREL